LLSIGDDAIEAINALVQPLVRTATEQLAREGIAANDTELSLSADMRYRGQAYEISVPWNALEVTPSVIASACARFHNLHEAHFAHSDTNATPEVLTLRVRAVGTLGAPSALSSAISAVDESSSTRRIYSQRRWQHVPVVTRAALVTTAKAGPLIIEDRHTTIIIPAGWSVGIAGAGCLAATRSGASTANSEASSHA
jgi:N-methylhydantoinase A